MMKSPTLLLLLLLLVAACSSINAQKAIFILAGQSNMAGRGGIKYLDPTPENPLGAVWNHTIPPDSQSSPHILRLNAKLAWEVATEPLHADIDTSKVCGVGPGMAFANEVLKRKPCLGVIGLVPCAKGGTYMAEWSRGTELYNRIINRTAAALQCGGRLEALLWYQGENQADKGVGLATFATDVLSFFTSLREDLKAPNLPIIQVALSPDEKGDFTLEIREIQLNLKFPFLTTVDANGSDMNIQDHVHLTTSSQVILGKKMAMAFLDMIH